MAEKVAKPKRQELKSQYESQVVGEIRRWAKVHGPETSDDRGFLLWATDLILDDYDIEATEEQILGACSLDKTRDLKLDAGYVDRETQRVFLVQAKHWDPTKLVGDEPFFNTWEALDLLSDQKRVAKANRLSFVFSPSLQDRLPPRQ